MFDVSLPLLARSEGKEEGEELVRGLMTESLVLEVWHHHTPPTQQLVEANTERGVVSGRRLAPAQVDVLLGVAHIPLLKLLSCTGTYVHVYEEGRRGEGIGGEGRGGEG